MADKPTKVQYVLGGRCTGLSTEVDPRVEAILTQLGAIDAYVPQGKLTITLENYVEPDTAFGGTAAK